MTHWDGILDMHRMKNHDSKLDSVTSFASLLNHGLQERVRILAYFCPNLDGFVRSPKNRHPGESRGPEVLVFPGFRLSPE